MYIELRLPQLLDLQEAVYHADNNEFATEEEVENIKLYLNLEQMRFDDHFTYKVLINKNLEVEDWVKSVEFWCRENACAILLSSIIKKLEL